MSAMSSSQELPISIKGNSEETEEMFADNSTIKDVQMNVLKVEEPLEKKKESKEDETTTSTEAEEFTPKGKSGRKRKFKEDLALHILTEEFLNVYYPISSCLSKSVSIGISKQENYTPLVSLRQSAKKVMFSEKAWESFNKYLHLIECYLTNRVYGKKTNVALDNSDIEVENIKIRGGQCVKFRCLTKYEEKVTLSRDEFETLVTVVPVINRYMKQLTFSLPMIKDYLESTIESDTPLIYGPVDASIYNRLPQEVFTFRRMKAKKYKVEKDEGEQCYSNCCYKHETSCITSEEEINGSASQPATDLVPEEV